MADTRQEVITHVTEYVNARYAGDWHAAFDREDDDGDGRLSRAEIAALLARAGVGFRLTRWAVALEIIGLFDSDADGMVSFAEFQKITGMGA